MMTNSELQKSLRNMEESKEYYSSEDSASYNSWSGEEYSSYSDYDSSSSYDGEVAPTPKKKKNAPDSSKKADTSYYNGVEEVMTDREYNQLLPGPFDDFESYAKKNKTKINAYTAEKHINYVHDVARKMENSSKSKDYNKQQQVYSHGMNRDMSDDYYSELKKHQDSLQHISRKPLGGIAHRIKKWYAFNTSNDVLVLTEYLKNGHQMSGFQRKRYDHLFFQMFFSKDMDTINYVVSMMPAKKITYMHCVAILFNPHFLSDEFSLLMMQEYNVKSPLPNLNLAKQDSNYSAKYPEITNHFLKQLDNPDFIQKSQSLWIEVLAGTIKLNTESVFAKHIAPYYIMRKHWDSLALMDNALDMDIEGLLKKHVDKTNGGMMEELYHRVSQDFTTMVNNNYGVSYHHANTNETNNTGDDNSQVVKESVQVKNIVPDVSQEVLDKIYVVHKNIKENLDHLDIEQKHAVQKIMIEYLPKVMDDYFSIAPQYRDKLKDHNNFTSNELLLHTLENIHETLQAVDEEINLNKIKKLSVAKHYTASFKR